MARARSRHGGYMMIGMIFVVMALAALYLIRQSGSVLQAVGGRYVRTQTTLASIQKGLTQFVEVNGRLPCPANPALATSAAGAGFPNQNLTLSTPVVTCTYPTGIVPWRALGLGADDVADEWGRMISYRVFDGSIGLTQAGGASRVNCDTSNGSSRETYPTGGLCSTDTNTLDTSFTSHRSYPTTSKLKGLVVSDFGTSVNNVAYVLISHGPSGLGGYLATGIRMTSPGATAGDYANIQSPTYYPSQSPAAYLSLAGSTPDVIPGSAGHYDDVVAYVSIDNLSKLSRLVARDWPEAPLPQFTSGNAPVPGAAPTTDPLNPRWTTTGSTSATAYTAATVSGQTVITGPTAALSGSACLWWPNLLTLNSVTSNYRQGLAIYVEFAAADNTGDTFPGFTMGFLSGLESQPDTLTCGTTALEATATGANGASTITVANTAGVHERVSGTGSAGSTAVTVADATGIVAGMNVTGTGVRAGATVSSIAGNVVTLSATNTGAVSGNITFTNIEAGMDVTGTGIGTSGTGTFAKVSSISGSTVTLGNSNTSAVSGTVAFADSRLIRRDLGWAGGTLASYTNRFATEFDANIDTGSAGPPVVPTANDPVSPHLAGDYAGVTHGTDAESCSTTNFGSPCDMPPATFTGTSKTAVTVVGTPTIVVLSNSGIVTGMSVTGTGIGSGATVLSVSGLVVTLSANSTLSLPVTVATFAALSTGNFMQDGLSTFNSMRADLTPFACLSKASSTGSSGGFTLSVPNKTTLVVGMGVSGANIATGATIRSLSPVFNQVTLTLAHTAAVSTTADFSLLPDTTKSATGSSGASTVTVADTRWIGIGMSVTGTGIGGGALVTDISGTTVTLSVPNSSAVASAIAFAAPNPAKTATGTSGASTITVSDTKGVATGMRAFGDGIADGTTVTAITGTTLTLSAATTDTISGTVTLRPAQTQLKTWTFSNAGCNADSVSCTAMKNTSTPFSQDLSADPQALSTLVCLDVPTPSTAFDDVYFGFTTSNRVTANTRTGANIAFRGLAVTNVVQP